MSQVIDSADLFTSTTSWGGYDGSDPDEPDVRTINGRPAEPWEQEARRRAILAARAEAAALVRL